MRISVECGGYAEAADACRTANHVAALLTESLAGKLAAYAGMAGDDATSSDFAAAYDPAAREAVATLADLTHALVGLGRLVDASGRNHDRAEAAAAGRTNAYTGRRLDEDSFVRVSPAPPPSSLGGSVATGLGEIHAWILDQVEGFVWPGADVGLLRDAASAWRRTSGSVADLTAHLDVVTRLLEHQVSPEIPLALAAIADLRSLVEDTADQLLALADACEDYAGGVEGTRTRTRALLTEIGQMVVEEVAITAIVAGITGGLGGGVKAAAALARIRAQAPRFHALLTSLRAVVATGAARLRAAEDQLARAREGFDRFVQAPVRDERGEMVHPLGWRTNQRARLARIAETIADPRIFDPHDLRGMPAEDLGRLLRGWPSSSSARGDGVRFKDPDHYDRQIRIMDGYGDTRPDALTSGPYVVVSQNGTKVKIPLEGNPLL
ncbi:hypothetical protein GCM10011376_33980 [Nocardioides flavus (ex Wang et al. 2016)]|uniref:WXG100 family type VII secretion target n=1 Tax=Nocardioides flavus (ex Wang et al. 2016) TaxID=2058780 RepID=A0ABQ3HM98_9ACTN|nr:hypothetical protein [Nocardioides flavus (ex Wang et al. 2016)]GHE18788.1 hypothetical protein GCM10011376_33980 [Nocardioides flavus (ex Wang et al. 2016)]